MAWLLRQLQHRNNSFLISYDGSQEDYEKLRNAVASSRIDARCVIINHSDPIYWCGPSQARSMLHLMERAVSMRDWEFLINLSGTCFPLWSQKSIFGALRASRSQGIEAHLFSFRVKRLSIVPPYEAKNVTLDRRVGRLHLRGSREILDYFSDEQFFPVLRVANRPFVDCREIFESKKLLHVARPVDDAIAFRQAYFKESGHFCGRAWYVFYRRAVESFLHFAQSDRARDWRELFLNCFEPDETFIQMAIEAHGAIPLEKFSRQSLRAFQGSPRNLTDKDLFEIMGQSHALFARKIDRQNSTRLMNWVQLRVNMED